MFLPEGVWPRTTLLQMVDSEERFLFYLLHQLIIFLLGNFLLLRILLLLNGILLHVQKFQLLIHDCLLRFVSVPLVDCHERSGETYPLQVVALVHGGENDLDLRLNGDARVLPLEDCLWILEHTIQLLSHCWGRILLVLETNLHNIIKLPLAHTLQFAVAHILFILRIIPFISILLCS